MFSALPAYAATENISLSCKNNQPRRVTLASDARSDAEITTDATSPVSLEIEESGLETVLDKEVTANARTVALPPRFSWSFLTVTPGQALHLSRKQQGDPHGSVLLTLHCDKTPALQSRLDWVALATPLSRSIAAQTISTDFDSTLSRAESLYASAQDDKTRAFASHIRAQLMLVFGHSTDAAAAFATAESAWLAIDDKDRARLARVARTEDLIRAGSYTEALTLTRSFPGAPSTSSYFEVRLERSRCLALAYTSHHAEAAECYQVISRHLLDLQEIGEYVNTLQAQAGLDVDTGNLDHARTLAQSALSLAAGADAPLYRGRLHALLADIALRSGIILESLAESECALVEFASAHAPRWEANVMLKLAQLHEQLGDYDEALAFLDAALLRLSFRDAPSRVAMAIQIFSDIERDTGDLISSRLWKLAAETMFERLGMSDNVDFARIERLDLDFQLGDLSGVEHALAGSKGHSPAWKMLSLKVALKRNHLADARAMLDSLRQDTLSLPDQIRLATIEADYRRHNNSDPLAAADTLLGAATRLSALARNSPNPTLAFLLDRLTKTLQRPAIDLVFESTTQSEFEHRAKEVWPWLALRVLGQQHEYHRIRNAEQFDRAVAAELLGGPSGAKSAPVPTVQRELLSLMAQPSEIAGAKESPPPVADLAMVRQSLGDDSALIAYLDGESRGGVLWVTHDGARVFNAAAPDAVRESTLALRVALHTPATLLGEVRASAQTLSTQLLGSLPTGVPPKHLYIFADEMMPRVAWSTLIWPGQSAPLIETTAIEFVHLARDADVRASAQAAHGLHLIVASQDQTGNAPLARLANASAEPQLIRAALSLPAMPSTQPALQIAEGEQATRDAVLSALDEPGAWVHVAAHGMAQPHRIGYAGLWLAPSPSQIPQVPHPAAQASSPAAIAPAIVVDARDKLPAFLSWLDILERGVRADLVVLNACQLGDSGSAINGNLSFADAVSRAGAKQVVAASWPISDAAAALWVPAFYFALAADPQHNAAVALRAAQLRLRESRAFAHPFFWAGMQTTTRLELSALADQPSKIDSRSRR